MVPYLGMVSKWIAATKREEEEKLPPSPKSAGTAERMTNDEKENFPPFAPSFFAFLIRSLIVFIFKLLSLETRRATSFHRRRSRHVRSLSKAKCQSHF